MDIPNNPSTSLAVAKEQLAQLIRVYRPGSIAPELLPVDLATLTDPGPIKYLIDDFIPEDYPTSLYGDGGQGKSYIAMHIALSIITGHNFLNKAVRAKGNVLCLDWELDTNTQRHRWEEIAKGAGLTTVPPGLYYKRMESSLQEAANDVYTWITLCQPQLIILDSVGRASGNDPVDHGKSIAFLRLVETLGTTLLIDHQSKPGGDSSYASKREFGSAFKGHYVRSSWQLERVGEDTNIIGLVFRHKKSNFGPLLGDIHATLLFKPLENNCQAVSLVTASSESEVGRKQFGLKSQIITCLKQENMTSDKIAEAIPDGDPGSIRNEITALKRSGLVIETGRDGRKPILGLVAKVDNRFKVDVDN